MFIAIVYKLMFISEERDDDGSWLAGWLVGSEILATFYFQIRCKTQTQVYEVCNENFLLVAGTSGKENKMQNEILKITLQDYHRGITLQDL